MDISVLKDFPLFGFMKDENLETITTCMNGKFVSYNAGDAIELEKEDFPITAFVVSGEIDACTPGGKVVTLNAGTLFGKDCLKDGGAYIFDSFKAHSEATIFMMQHAVLTEPCWFSCFFHAAFIDEFDKLKSKQKAECLKLL